MNKYRVKTVAVSCGWLLLAVAVAAGSSAPAQAPAPALDRPVLLVIDIQNFYFAGGRIPLVGSVEASLKAKSAIEAFRAKKLPVIHVQHMPPGIERFEPGVTDLQYAIHPNVAPIPGEAIVVKHFANSFRETGLAAILKELNIKTLVVAGMQTHMCVEAAVRAGADLGFDIVLVEDACATRDLKFHDATVLAASVQTAVLAALNGSYARVVTVADILAALR
jgi:nicotinamidase-related amidase